MTWKLGMETGVKKFLSLFLKPFCAHPLLSWVDGHLPKRMDIAFWSTCLLYMLPRPLLNWPSRPSNPPAFLRTGNTSHVPAVITPGQHSSQPGRCHGLDVSMSHVSFNYYFIILYLDKFNLKHNWWSDDHQCSAWSLLPYVLARF